MNTLVKIEVTHSNHINIKKFHDKLNTFLEEYVQEYMSDADKYKDKSIDIKFDYYTKINP